MRKIDFNRVLGRASTTSQYREILTPRNLVKHPVWLIFSVTCLFIGIVAVFGYTDFVAADSSVGDPPPIPPKYEELLIEARENGSVLVTVTFDVGFQPSSMTAYENYVAIQRVRNQLIMELSAYHVTPHWSNINWVASPFLALEVNEYALLYLIGCDYVTDISPGILRFTFQ